MFKICLARPPLLKDEDILLQKISMKLAIQAPPFAPSPLGHRREESHDLDQLPSRQNHPDRSMDHRDLTFFQDSRPKSMTERRLKGGIRQSRWQEAFRADFVISVFVNCL
jgi:hypothetical protein